MLQSSCQQSVGRGNDLARGWMIVCRYISYASNANKWQQNEDCGEAAWMTEAHSRLKRSK